MPRWKCMVHGCTNPATYRSKSGFLYCEHHGRETRDSLKKGDPQEKKDRWPMSISSMDKVSNDGKERSKSVPVN